MSLNNTFIFHLSRERRDAEQRERERAEKERLEKERAERDRREREQRDLIRRQREHEEREIQRRRLIEAGVANPGGRTTAVEEVDRHFALSMEYAQAQKVRKKTDSSP